MTRQLHEQDVCEWSDASLQEEIDRYREGDVLVVAADDDRLKSLVPVGGQQRLFGDHLSFGDDATIHFAAVPHPQTDQETHMPSRNDERFHFDTNSYDTVIFMVSRCPQYQRGPPFLDLTRVTRPGGTLLAITGLEPEESRYRDAKWWVPNSDDATLDSIRILQYEDYQTPRIISVFTVTATEPQHPNATITTGLD